MNARKPWDIVCFSDSGNTGDPVSRRRVNGFILYVLGVTASWKSKAQRSVTLSSSVAEWVALFETVKEVMFETQLQGSMKISVQLPVMVRVENVGAVFMASNITITSHMKYIDIRYKYIKLIYGGWNS